MKIHVETGAPEARRADLLVVPVTEPAAGGSRKASPASRPPGGLAGLDRGLGGGIAAAWACGDFRGRKGEQLLLHSQGALPAARVLLLGLGGEAALGAEALRELGGNAVQAALRRRAERLAIQVPASRRLRAADAARALAEGVGLGAYRFDRHRARRPDEPEPRLRDAALLVASAPALRAARKAVAEAQPVIESQNLARDLSNEPPNLLPPVALAAAARKAARESGLRARVLGPAELRRLGFGAMLAVAGGSRNEPRLIVLEHRPKGSGGARRAGGRTLCLVGKGVCFDSGGLSLKPSTSMVKMKHDMSGGAAVIGAMRAIAKLRVPLHVVGVIGAVENLPGGAAYRPDDILTSLSGQTIEVSNTDAEGRLVLADALHWAIREYRPEAIVDVATLTGACNVALGPWAAAVISNRDALAERVLECGEEAGERFWRLPLWDAHREHMRGSVADVKQTGGPAAGTTTAAAFLSYFVGQTAWAHLDIASTADTERVSPTQPLGATGVAVRTLVALARSLAVQRLREG